VPALLWVRISASTRPCQQQLLSSVAEWWGRGRRQRLVICNGPAFSPDNPETYFSDSVGQRILCYDLGEDGPITGRRTFYEFSIDEGLPDGLTVDSWAMSGVRCMACESRVHRYEPDFALSLPVPGNLSNKSVFRRSRPRTMFVTRDGTPRGSSEEPDNGGSVLRHHIEHRIPEPIFDFSLLHNSKCYRSFARLKDAPALSCLRDEDYFRKIAALTIGQLPSIHRNDVLQPRINDLRMFLDILCGRSRSFETVRQEYSPSI